jgi:hypothetical protein
MFGMAALRGAHSRKAGFWLDRDMPSGSATVAYDFIVESNLRMATNCGAPLIRPILMTLCV